MSVNYLSKAGAIRFLTKIKNWTENGFVAKDGVKVLSDNNFSNAEKTKLQGISEGATNVIVDSVLSTSSTNAIENGVVATALNNKAGLSSPSFTGSPTAPTQTAGDKSTKIATTKFVGDAISAAIGQVKQMSFTKVTSLPATGDTTKIYLLAKATSQTNNAYDEYIWDADNSEYELIGSTSIDLSGYVLSSDLVAVTDAEIDAMFE